jgi:hypothetical protein
MGLSKTGQLIDVLYLQAPKKSDTLAYLNTGPKRIEAMCWLSGNRNFVWTALMRGKGRHPVEKSRHRAAKV